MKIVQGDELQWVRGLEHRGGMFHFRNLMEGEPGTIENVTFLQRAPQAGARAPR